MKYLLSVLVLITFFSSSILQAQDNKSVTSCKMYLNGNAVEEMSKETILEWCKLVPPTVICDDERVYRLERFRINFLSLSPFMNSDFGIGEKGIPIKAVRAVENGQAGDALILKEVVYINEEGIESSLPTISFKLQ